MDGKTLPIRPTSTLRYVDVSKNSDTIFRYMVSFSIRFFFSSIEAFETIFNILPADLRAPRRFVTLWGLIKTLPPFRAQTAWNYSWMVYVPKSVTLRYSLSGEKIRYKNQTPLFRQFVEAALVEGTFHSNIKYLRPLFPSNFQINLRSFFSRAFLVCSTLLSRYYFFSCTRCCNRSVPPCGRITQTPPRTPSPTRCFNRSSQRAYHIDALFILRVSTR